jgi:hypothetical protein
MYVRNSSFQVTGCLIKKMHTFKKPKSVSNYILVFRVMRLRRSKVIEKRNESLPIRCSWYKSKDRFFSVFEIQLNKLFGEQSVETI